MFRPAAVFSDHMVLQRERPIAVFGEADGAVKVRLNGLEATATPHCGRFEARLPAMAAGGPYELNVSCGNETITYRDVMVGEVWLCGGQSNMEFRLSDDRHGAEEIANGDDAMLRFYTVAQEARVDGAMLARERENGWKSLSPGACGDVSAVAYYAGRRLREALGVAVGMLICCIGGTPISCWISRESLEACPEGRSCLETFEAAIEGVTDEEYARREAEYAARVDAWVAAADALKASRSGLRGAEVAAQIGDFPWPPPDGRWMLRRPGGPWETMVRRVSPYGARGLFWYQGETDSGNPGRYAALFGRMMADWREAFENEALWVVAAQLPGYGADPAAEDWPGIRAAQQRATDDDDHAALACLIDCGDSEDIHPYDKRAPGARLANLALMKAYARPVRSEAPRLVGAAREDGGAVLRFTEPLSSGTLTDALTFDGAPCEARAFVTAEGDLRIEGVSTGRIAYARSNDPRACLFGRDTGLPAFPFEAWIGRQDS